ncbi:diguanylate cyclase [Xanthobacter sp. KR7-225]|uniref:sensor domain-containing diguanylate cyclase n=1 Tax=Xanthobacter sp. KR7-225 TaxID=3156613 RepID=UPI0032B562BF
MPGSAHFLFYGSLVAAVLVAILAGITIWQSYSSTWESAQRTSDNLLRSVTGYVDRHIRLFTFGLDMVGNAESDPEIAALSDEAKVGVLQTIAGSTDYIGNVVEIDTSGQVVRSARPIPPEFRNLADREYFISHRENPDMGLHVSRPYQSLMRKNEWAIAFSRRLTHPDGSFAGVVAISVRLAYIQAFFSELDMGPNGALLLLSTSGRILARQPPRQGPGDVGSDLSGTSVFKRMEKLGSGSFVARAAVDGIERYYTFARIPQQPLIVNVALARRDILAPWWRRSELVAIITLITCSLIIFLATVLRRELRRRAQVEADLAFLSITDGLTGLANRRRFDDAISREWRRTKRTGTALALLMIDVDRFKLLNDRYGHARGDEALKAIARLIEGCIRRPGDTAARYGGEEFAVILPDTDANGAVSIAESIRAKIERGVPDVPPFTVSIGVKSVRPTPESSLQEFQHEADKALYQAKAEGRNRVVLAG